MLFHLTPVLGFPPKNSLCVRREWFWHGQAQTAIWLSNGCELSGAARRRGRHSHSLSGGGREALVSFIALLGDIDLDSRQAVAKGAPECLEKALELLLGH